MASFKNSAGWKLTGPRLYQRHSPSSHFASEEPDWAKIQSKTDKNSAIIMAGLAHFLTKS